MEHLIVYHVRQHTDAHLKQAELVTIHVVDIVLVEKAEDSLNQFKQLG